MIWLRLSFWCLFVGPFVAAALLGWYGQEFAGYCVLAGWWCGAMAAIKAKELSDAQRKAQRLPATRTRRTPPPAPPLPDLAQRRQPSAEDQAALDDWQYRWLSLLMQAGEASPREWSEWARLRAASHGIRLTDAQIKALPIAPLKALPPKPPGVVTTTSLRSWGNAPPDAAEVQDASGTSWIS